MNKDFMLLNDNTIEVTNEYGQEINRGEFENKNVKGILLAENKIELTDIFKESFDERLYENQKVLKLSNIMLKLQIILIIGFPFFGFLIGAITNQNTWLIHGIYESIQAFAGSLIPISISTIYWIIIRKKYKKNIKKLELLINKAENIKKESEKELIAEKNKTITSKLELLVKVPIEEETNIIAKQLAEEIVNYHHENIKSKGKTRIRKR